MSLQPRHRRSHRVMAALTIVLAATPLAACLSSETFAAHSQYIWETETFMEYGGRNGHGADYPLRMIRALESRSRHRGDRVADRSRGTALMVGFSGLDRGQRVVVFGDDFFIRAISAVVGRDGHVTAWRPTDVIERHGNVWGSPAAIERLGNVSVDRSAPSELRLPPDLDLVLMVGSYHALQSGGGSPGTTAVVNQAAYEALRPGGRFVIVDRHSDETGGGEADRLHQIDTDRVLDEAHAASFYLDIRRVRVRVVTEPGLAPADAAFQEPGFPPANVVMLRFGKPSVIPPYSPRE